MSHRWGERIRVCVTPARRARGGRPRWVPRSVHSSANRHPARAPPARAHALPTVSRPRPPSTPQFRDYHRIPFPLFLLFLSGAFPGACFVRLERLRPILICLLPSLPSQRAALEQEAYDEKNKLLNQTQFQELLELQTDEEPDFMEEIVQMYVSDAEEMLSELVKIFEAAEPDYNKARAVLHKLKGSSSTFGADGVQQKCEELREHCIKEDIDACREGAGSLKQLREDAIDRARSSPDAPTRRRKFTPRKTRRRRERRGGTSGRGEAGRRFEPHRDAMYEEMYGETPRFHDLPTRRHDAPTPRYVTAHANEDVL